MNRSISKIQSFRHSLQRAIIGIWTRPCLSYWMNLERPYSGLLSLRRLIGQRSGIKSVEGQERALTQEEWQLIYRAEIQNIGLSYWNQPSECHLSESV